jgi:hypothetical protein
MNINNLTIKYQWRKDKWQVIAPNKKMLREFAKEKDAKDYAKSNKTYSTRSKW